MIGLSKTSGSISPHSSYLNAPEIMPKRKTIEDVKTSNGEQSEHVGEVEDKLNNLPAAKKRRVSRRLQNAKLEDEKMEIKTEVEQQPSTESDADSDDAMDSYGISSYEKMRLKNIEDNAKFFASLEIFKAKEDLSIASGTAVKKTPTTRGLKREKKPKEVLPRRPRSLRLQRIDPKGEALPPLPIVELSENIHERKPSEPIDMVPINVPEESKENYSTGFVKMMGDLAKSPKPSSAPKASTDLQTFCKAFDKMRLTSVRIAKVTKDRIFSVAIHPSERKVLACAGDKWGKIGVWDVEAQDHSEDGVYLFEPHSRPVNCLQFAPANPSKIYSASYDGTVRCGDFEKGTFDEVYATPDDENIMTNGFDFLNSDGSQLLVSQNDRGGYLAVVDTRKRSNPKQVFSVHDRAVKTVSVHPVKKHYFVTSSSDSTVALWDMRSMKETGRNKPIVSLRHGRTLSAAYFSPVTGSKILTTSYDDNIRIYTCTDAGDVLKGAEIFSTLRHDNHTGRWVTGFRATWHPTREDVFVSGSMARPRKIEVFDDHGRILHNFMDEEWLGSICSLNTFHPTRNILAGANSSGKLHVFM